MLAPRPQFHAVASSTPKNPKAIANNQENKKKIPTMAAKTMIIQNTMAINLKISSTKTSVLY